MQLKARKVIKICWHRYIVYNNLTSPHNNNVHNTVWPSTYSFSSTYMDNCMFTRSTHVYKHGYTYNQCFAFKATQTVNELRNHNYIATCFPDGTFPVLPSCMSKSSLPSLPPALSPISPFFFRILVLHEKKESAFLNDFKPIQQTRWWSARKHVAF